MMLPPGVTERQKQHWVTSGFIFDETDDPSVKPGWGHKRKWTPELYRRLYAMGVLRQVGFDTYVAADLARQIAAGIELIQMGPVALILREDEFFGSLTIPDDLEK